MLVASRSVAGFTQSGRLATLKGANRLHIKRQIVSLQADSPIIAVPALLRLAEWASKLRSTQGGESCEQSPPGAHRTDIPVVPSRNLSQELPAEAREKVLQKLGQVVAQHLSPPSVVKEVANDD